MYSHENKKTINFGLIDEQSVTQRRKRSPFKSEAPAEEEEVQKDVKKATSAVEDTWGSIKLDKDILKYTAEDKEIEYEV